MLSPKEDPPRFEDFIELDQPMTPQEATEKLAAFHGKSDDAVLNAFTKLRDCKNGTTVVFKSSINNGTPCISMDGLNPDGNVAWWHLIHKSTGQPMMHIS